MDVDGQGDSADARGLLWRAKPVTHEAVLSVPRDSDKYFMKHTKRGKCLVFNNKEFEPHTNLNVRNGTDADATSLYRCFRGLDFDVNIHHNLGVRKILSILGEAAKEDHSRSDCFACCILTHGDTGVLFGRDGKFLVDEVFAPFRGDACLTLAGKPKLFFIQACQGDKLDSGVKVKYKESTDSDGMCKIPTHADFLIAYSTVPGFYSWRNTSNGSWFIQALCEVLEKHAKNMDLLQMMTLVNHKVAYDYQSCVPNNPSMDMMKQVPCITSTLTRKVYFPPQI